MRSNFLISLLLVFLAASCQSAPKKTASATQPMQATAPSLPAPEPADSSQASEEAAEAEVDRVEDYLAQVDKEFQSGKADYLAGHLESAKAKFDRVFNMLLQAPEDVRDDERLEIEFEKYVDAVHSLELQALKEGDPFAEQKAEPAPIDVPAQLTPPVDPGVRAEAEAEIRTTLSDLPLVMNDYVAGFINYFSNRGQETLQRAWIRAGRYREMIARIFKEEGVPQDLIFMAQAESGFHPLALSRAGARGMWQFMAKRATGYGLRRNWWVDERQDPEKSTRAAARHLRDLYKQFGDWYLAMAAYNSGPGTVQRAVQRTGYADFWELYRRGVLPAETRNYVPIILAVTIMSKNPENYGLDRIDPERPFPVDRVKINYPVDLRLVAECVDTSAALLQELNPSLLRMTTPKEGEFELLLPQGTKDKFQKAIAAIPREMRVWWRYHKVAAGDTLAALARKYRTTAADIAEVNNLSEADELAIETKLIIPVTPSRAGRELVYAKTPTRYRVRKGDTVLSIADDFGVPADRLRRWNRIRGNRLRTGRRLVIYKPIPDTREPYEIAALQNSSKSNKRKVVRASAKAPSAAPAAADGRTTHTVRPGDTLYSIAITYKTTVDALRRDNRLASNNIHPGDVLIVRPK